MLIDDPGWIDVSTRIFQKNILQTSEPTQEKVRKEDLALKGDRVGLLSANG
jgi:hypothetical protein